MIHLYIHLLIVNAIALHIPTFAVAMYTTTALLNTHTTAFAPPFRTRIQKSSQPQRSVRCPVLVATRPVHREAPTIPIEDPNEPQVAPNIWKNTQGMVGYAGTEFQRWINKGRIGNFNVQNVKTEEKMNYYSSHVRTTTYEEIKLFGDKAINGEMQIEQYLEFINSPGVLGKLTTEESFMEFLSVIFAYVDVEPGMIINCAVETSDITDTRIHKFAAKYVVTRVISHDHSGFFGFLLEPYTNIPSHLKGAFKSLFISRGTTLFKSKKEIEKGSCNGLLPLDLDSDGVAYNFAHWKTFETTILESLSHLESSTVIFGGHSLAGAISVRLLNLIAKDLPALFEKSYVYAFNAPRIELLSVPNLKTEKHKVVYFTNKNDPISSMPMHVSQNFLTFYRSMIVENSHWAGRYLAQHISTPLTQAALQNVRFTDYEILNNKDNKLDKLKELITSK